MIWFLSLIIARTFLCPKLDTGRFFFKEYLYVKERVQDSFKGVFRFNGRSFELEVSYPDKQFYFNHGDTLIGIFDTDTSMVVRPNLEDILTGRYEQNFKVISHAGGCLLLPFPGDTALMDSILLKGESAIHSLTLWLKEGRKIIILLERERE